MSCHAYLYFLIISCSIKIAVSWREQIEDLFRALFLPQSSFLSEIISLLGEHTLLGRGDETFFFFKNVENNFPSPHLENIMDFLSSRTWMDDGMNSNYYCSDCLHFSPCEWSPAGEYGIIIQKLNIICWKLYYLESKSRPFMKSSFSLQSALNCAASTF